MGIARGNEFKNQLNFLFTGDILYGCFWGFRNLLRKVCISWDGSRLVELRNSRGTETTSATCWRTQNPLDANLFLVNYWKSQRPTWNISCKLFSQMGRDYWARQSNKDRRFRHEGLAHRYVCSLAKVVPHAKLRSFTLLFYISANGSLVYPVLYMSISHFLS